MGGLSIDEIEDIDNDKIQIEGPDNVVCEVVTRAGDGKKALAVDAAVTVSDVKIKGDTDDTLIGNNGDSLLVEVTASALPTGAATEAKQDTGNTSLAAIDTQMTDGTQVTKVKGATDGTEIGNTGDRLNTCSKIEGDSDGTKIGNVDDNLRVIARFSNAPAGHVVHFSEIALNGGSGDLTVDGSSTPVEFTIGPGAGVTWYIFEFNIIIDDTGNANPDSYGAIASGLTNGLLIEQTIDSTDYEFDTIKTNAQLVQAFGAQAFRGTANAFLNSGNFYSGTRLLREPIRLDGTAGDEIKVTVQDDLSGLTTHEFSIQGFVEV